MRRLRPRDLCNLPKVTHLERNPERQVEGISLRVPQLAAMRSTLQPLWTLPHACGLASGPSPYHPRSHSADHVWVGGEFLGSKQMNKYCFNFNTVPSTACWRGISEGGSAGREGRALWENIGEGLDVREGREVTQRSSHLILCQQGAGREAVHEDTQEDPPRTVVRITAGGGGSCGHRGRSTHEEGQGRGRANKI